jgi:hypothetical protein
MNRASCSLSRAQPSPQQGQVNSASHCLHRRLAPWTCTDHTLSATATMPGDNRSRSSTRTAAFAAPDRPGTSRYRTQGLPQPRSLGRREAGVLRGTAPSAASHGRHPPTAKIGRAEPRESLTEEETKAQDMPPAGRSDSGMDGSPFASAGRIVASVVGSHPDHLRPRQNRAVAAQGVKEAPIDRQVACRRCSRGIFMLVRCL